MAIDRDFESKIEGMRVDIVPRTRILELQERIDAYARIEETLAKMRLALRGDPVPRPGYGYESRYQVLDRGIEDIHNELAALRIRED